MLEWLESLPHALVLRHSGTAYLFVSAAHIASIGLLLGSIVALDLCLLGFARVVPLAAAGPYLSRVAVVGLALAVLTGGWLFSVRASEYAANPAFLAKLGIVGAAVLNAAIVHGSGAWRRALSATSPQPAVRAHAAVSMLLWLAAVVAGRWIGFL